MSCRVVDIDYLWFFGICADIFPCTPWFFHNYLGVVVWLGIGYWVLGIGYWVLGIGYWNGVV